ncbi:GLPGLI family protein [Flavobacterium aquatile]|uniref:GLPGLI family protein n=1 Tax=Flavobacterium aquatile LMG 4008 = ATCC 11947 TaxID=1453498 RepID=A0A095SWE1_9FLAO|nr:GLPGLI family protein [Flavobacterium aquatile]KGD68907.1 hypothetical protein LG45_04505 [Flavobacterium aquatile LMG 4008 = ATCC 11947]OXA65620.1 GLPGLI family protein [Flavobacterium aquatile] [Flavobacterium aquatile LMG 4008 = ATCC 11947]GEC80234.1 GLPGLI family protein [Flavobacterium aquatile]
MRFLFFLLFFQTLFSQSTIEVVYKSSFNGDFLSKENKDNPNLKTFNNGIENKISTLKFQLLINENKSLFKSIPEMEREGETTGEKMAKIVTGFENKYYTDLKLKKIIIDEVFADKNDKVDLGFDTYKWEFLNETKEINGYKCYLAKTKFAHLDVFAWYCPKLPYSFGPMEFSNLPGLVLELQKGNVIFQVEKITLDSKNKIDFDITKFQTITKEERDIYLKKQRESFGIKYGN